MYGARKTDPVTSHLSATDTPARLTQRDRILLAYFRENEPLADEDVAALADVDARSCWWKRCSELRQAGLTEVSCNPLGLPKLALSSMGRYVQLSEITTAGRAYLRTKGLI